MKLISRIVSILLAITVVYPLIFIFLVSLKDNKEFFSNVFGLPELWRWSNYVSAWTEGGLSGYIKNSVVVSMAAVLASVLISALGGYALSKMYIPKAGLILGVLMSLNFVPGVAVYIPLYSQMNQMHLSGTLWMLILPYIAWQIPFSIYIFKNFFDTVPSELIEAARVDGCTELKIFGTVILPLVRPAIATVMVFNFINIWGEYMWASIASVASTKISTLPVGLLYFRGEYGIEWGPFAAAIMIIIVPLLLIFIYLQKYFIQGLTSGAVKG